jgi:hypothetical protein
MAIPLAVPLAMAGVGLASKGIGAAYAARNEKRALRELQRLNAMPVDRYSQSPQMQEFGRFARQDAYNPQGFTFGERQSAMQDIAQASNTSYQRGLNLAGGQMSRAIQGVNTANTLGALNRFGSQDAALRRQIQGRGLSNLGSVARNEQSLQNMNVQTDLQRRLMAEQAAGRAAQQWRDYKFGTLTGMGNDLLGAGMNIGMGKMMGYGNEATTTSSSGGGSVGGGGTSLRLNYKKPDLNYFKLPE